MMGPPARGGRLPREDGPPSSIRIEFPDVDKVRLLCGVHQENLKLVERRTGVQLGARGQQVVVAGGDVAARDLAERVLRELYGLVDQGYPLYLEDVDQAAKLVAQGQSPREVFGDTIYVTARHRIITPKNMGQRRYVKAIREHDIVFGIGPAGTGKTYLAMAMAVAHLVERKVKRIVLTRPAVEAGERLGFLPGDLSQKVDPYLRPMYDALYEMLGFEKVTRLIERNVIEVAPLAFMRGRTLNDAFIILDEAQNTTIEQMKMFLTRIGFGSKAVVTGDVTQTDLPGNRISGLLHVIDVLRGVQGVAFTMFTSQDVVRHPLVQRIVQAYERAGDKE